MADLTKTPFIPKILGLTHRRAPFSRTGKMPVPQRGNFLVEQAEKPVPKQVIENGATSQLEDTYIETWLMAGYCVSDPSVRLILTALALTNHLIGYKYK
ncbi:hypothetical protein QUA46_19030 [Microcoleus sp. MON2_D6]|uniref:hypothetical protein n=1 Tax=unclassified Microcoleus TaxID=2642155 RepID=UPI002FCFBAA8